MLAETATGVSFAPLTVMLIVAVVLPPWPSSTGEAVGLAFAGGEGLQRRVGDVGVGAGAPPLARLIRVSGRQVPGERAAAGQAEGQSVGAVDIARRSEPEVLAETATGVSFAPLTVMLIVAVVT